MALVFLDSFEHYSNAQSTRKWTGGQAIINTGARTGSQCGQGGSTTFEEEYATLTAGIAYNTQAMQNAPIILSNSASGITARITHVGDGRLRFHFAADGSHIGNGTAISTFVLHTSEWYYLEFSATVTVNATGGGLCSVGFAAEARANGSVIITESKTYTGVTLTTDLSAHPSFATVTLQGPGGGTSARFDDCYVTDGEFLGDIRVAVLYPNAAGDLTDPTPVGAATDWEATKEHPADDDVSYAEFGSTGDKLLVNLDNITGFTGTIKGAQALWLWKKSDGGEASVSGKWKSGATVIDESGTPFHPSYLSYLYDRKAKRKSIFTAADWTISEIDTLQLGAERIS